MQKKKKKGEKENKQKTNGHGKHGEKKEKQEVQLLNYQQIPLPCLKNNRPDITAPVDSV